ncbi:hypothetical protein GCM10010112_92970 [Actinoplanes lobatus]|nr:hypothetical protein GCM10010112_92970 [Actinoplanes lobatus]GIE40568.1 hypothetical protein Alo02nite_34660 [Actinoplanes lobatus]
MLAIGAAAAAASFTHVHDVAAAHGQPGWLAWADAVVLELMSVAGGLELRRRKRVAARLWFPAVVLVVAVVLSLGAQVVEAEPSIIGWIAAALPAVGFLAMVKIALGRAGTDPQAGEIGVPAIRDGPGAADKSVRDGSGATEGVVPAVPDGSGITGSVVRTVPDRPRAADSAFPTVPDGWESADSVVPTVRDGSSTTDSVVRDGPGQPGAPSTPGADGPDVRELLPVAREAADSLARQGRPLSREALAEVLRGQGHAMSNARVSALVKLIREQPGTAETAAEEPVASRT